MYMTGRNLRPALGIICLLFVLAVWTPVTGQNMNGQWGDPLPAVSESAATDADSLTLEAVLGLVGQNNRTLMAGTEYRRAAEAQVDQAGKGPNPEFEFEADDVGGDNSGFSNAEFVFSLSQEFELWGKKGARKNVAEKALERRIWETSVERFDLYATAHYRFHILLHAQRHAALAGQSHSLAQEIVETIEQRVQKGAAMTSELLLGELEAEQSALELESALTELENARRRLAALWNADGSGLVVKVEYHNSLPGVTALVSAVGGARSLVDLGHSSGEAEAGLREARSEAKPNLTFSGGFKRNEAENTNTFLLGLSLPLPLFNRNQGGAAAFEAESRALDYERQQAEADARAELAAMHGRATRLMQRRDAIDDRVLPKAESTFETLKSAYKAGRLPYAGLLEARHTLIDIRSERNDLELEIAEEVLALETMLGLTFDRESVSQEQ